MTTLQMIHIEPSDAVQFSDPSATSKSGCLKIRNRHGNDLYLFPPDDLSDAQSFLTALIDRATELRDSVAVLAEVRMAAA